MTEPTGISPDKPRPTIRDVAREAGVSVGTVSAVINGRGNVAETTRRHVNRLIQELGFEPNSAARSLKRGRISSIGFVVPDLQNPFFAAVAEGVQRALSAHDILLTLCITWSQTEREEYYAGILRSQRMGGVIYLSGSGLPSPSLLKLAQAGKVVFVDENLPGMTVPFVNSDNRAGAREVATHVLEAGHRRIAIIGGPERLWTSEQRLAGFREAIAATGMNPDSVPVIVGDYDEPSGYAGAARFLSSPPERRPTAILCANDMMAMGVMRYCAEHGIAIPDELSVTGFDDIPGTGFLHPPLTTVVQPAVQMGKAATQLLLSRIGVNQTPPDSTWFPTTVTLRKSVRQLGDRDA